MKLVIFIGVLLAAPSLWADQITLKNGDRITGSIISADTKELIIETPEAAKITIKRSAIAAISADGPIYVGLSDGQTVAGSLETVNDQLRIQTRTAGTLNIAIVDVQTLRNQAEETAYETQIERYRNPRLVDLWGGFIDFGLAAARGNANTSTFNTTARAARTTTRDKISAYFTSIYSSSDVGTGVRTTTANARRGGITYDVNLNKKWFAWGAMDLESDEFQDLDLRFVPAGGVGHHTINREFTKLDFRLGISDNREFFSTGLDRNSVEVVLGEDFSHDFSKTTSIQQRLRLYPNVTDTPNGRVAFDLTFATKLKAWLSLQLTFSDRYLSNPVAGNKTNDVLYSAGVRVTWGLQ